jgi:CheY-like chemotaxis protein
MDYKPEALAEKIPQEVKTEKSVEILLAEDDDMCSVFIKALAARFNWNVTAADNGEEAVAIYKSRGFDAVIMDGQMPVMNGLDAARHIRELEKNSGGRRVPIIALTAYAMPEDRAKFIAAGMDDYITKPVTDSRALFEMVMKHIEKSRRG